MKLKRLSPAEFDRIVSMTNMTAATVHAARQVLVYGRPITTVAEESGVSKQWVFKAVSKIEAGYFNESGVGDALVNIELLLPEKIALQLYEMSGLIETHGIGTDNKVVNSAIDSLVDALKKVNNSLAG